MPTPSLRERRKVVDVEIVTPGQTMAGVKPGHGEGVWLALIKRADESVALGPLQIIDVTNEERTVGEVRPQRPHGVKAKPYQAEAARESPAHRRSYSLPNARRVISTRVSPR